VTLARGVTALKSKASTAGWDDNDPELPGTAYFDLVRGREAAGARDARARVLADGDRQRRQPDRPLRRGLPDPGPWGRARHDPQYGRRDPRRRRPLGADHKEAAHRPGSTWSRPRTAWACGPARRWCTARSTTLTTGSRTCGCCPGS